MKRFTFLNALLIAAALLLGSGTVYSQITISAGQTIFENFDDISDLPDHWKVDKQTDTRSIGSYEDAGTTTEYIAGNNMSGFATGGIYNFGDGPAGSASNRAIGGLCGSSGPGSVNVYVYLQNVGTTDIKYLTISYNVKKYRNGFNSEGFTVEMFYSSDGEDWRLISDESFSTKFNPDSDNDGFPSAPGDMKSVTGTLQEDLYLPANQPLYLAWNYSVTDGDNTENAQALGIDDVMITAYEEPCTSPNLIFNTEKLYFDKITSGSSGITAYTDNEYTPIVYTSSDETVATVDEEGTVTYIAPGEVTITASQEAGKYNGELYCAATDSYTLVIETIPAPEANEPWEWGIFHNGFTAEWNPRGNEAKFLLNVYSITETYLNEAFEVVNGSGGNNDDWSGEDTNDPLDELGDWDLTNVYAGNKCIRVGADGVQGSITTPELGFNGDATLTFSAGACSGEGRTKLLLEITGGGSLSRNTIIMGKAEFRNYSVDITGATPSTRITFKRKTNLDSPFFLDEVKVRSLAYVTGSPFEEEGEFKDVWGLTPDTKYYYTVQGVVEKNDVAFTSEYSNEIEVTTLETAPVTTFTETGTWNEENRWDNGIPDKSKVAIIKGNVTLDDINSEGACNTLIIDTDGALTIKVKGGETQVLIIYNDLLIKSDETGSGSLIYDNNIRLNDISKVTIQRYVSAANWGDAGSGWHLLSSPVSAQPITGKWTPSGNGNDYDFYALDESKPYEYWLNQKVAANNMITFIPGIGYLVAYQQSDTKEFNGAEKLNGTNELTINTSDVEISGLANSPESAYPGWHLLGNPFSSALQYDNTWTKSNIDAIIQVWNSQTGSYKTSTDVGGIIPAMNGFMVHTSGNGSITIPASKRVHNSTNWYKSGEDFILLVARDLDGTTSQSSIVRFNPAATAGYDSQFDSYFLAGFAPMFYSVSGEDLYALNTLPEQSSGLVVPFGFVKNNSFNFSIGLEKSLPGLVLFLTDNKTGETVNLTEAGSHQFTSEEGDDANRFALHFAPLGIEKPGAALDAKIYAYQQVVYLAGLDTKTEVTITDLMGRTVKRVQLNGGGLSTINAAGLPKGAYIVTAVSASGSVSAKVIL